MMDSREKAREIMKDDKAQIVLVIIVLTIIALALATWMRKADEREIEQHDDPITQHLDTNTIAHFQGAWLQSSNGSSFFPFEDADWTRAVQEMPDQLVAMTNSLDSNEIFVMLRSGISNTFVIQADDFDALRVKDGVIVRTNAVWMRE